MHIEEYKTLFVVGNSILMLVAMVPTFSLVIRIPSGSERFSELWLLGPEHRAENYPFNVSANEDYHLFVGVSNHLGSSSDYILYVKFRNQTQLPPNSTTSEPSSLPPIHEFRFVLSDGEVWETPLIFTIEGNASLIQNVAINDIVFPVNCISTWDSDRNGFYYQMFFELWLYNTTSQNFRYENRLFLGLWLNMTA